MVFFVWLSLLLFYLMGAVLYVLFSPFQPLGAMQNENAIYLLIITIFVGVFGAAFGYSLLTRLRLPTIKDIDAKPFLRFCSFAYLCLSVLLFLSGVQYYGGYFSFIASPYTPIYGGSAQNEIKDTLISTSGLLSIFSFISAFSSVKNEKTNRKLFLYIVCSVSLFVLLSIFIQGRRENMVLLVMSLFSYRLFSGTIDVRKIIKLVTLAFLVLLAAGVGLYIRESSKTSGGSVISATIFAMLFETHFTVATLANEIYTHVVDKVEFGGVIGLFEPLLFIVPSFFFSLAGESKQALFMNNEVVLYESKGGAFIFSEGFHSLGYFGVFVHGVLLGMLMAIFYRSAKRTGYLIYHFPIVSLLLVAMRKDVTYGVKYISLMYMLMVLFYCMYFFIPKKKY